MGLALDIHSPKLAIIISFKIQTITIEVLLSFLNATVCQFFLELLISILETLVTLEGTFSVLRR